MNIPDDVAAIEQMILLRKRQIAINDARERLGDFIKLMMPNPEFPADSTKSEYELAPHCKMLCEIITQVETGALKRVAVSIPPQHGKTAHLSTFGPAWILGRNPRARIVIASYNQTRAEELGEEFRKALDLPIYKVIFPEVELEYGSKSKSSMSTTKGGKIFFVGTGGTVTGRTAEYFIIDDPTKDDEELQSDNARDKLWKWFYSVAYSRGSKRTRIMVIHTRWHGDDLIGRLCDPTHPERNKRFADVAQDWTYFNLPGVIHDRKLADALGLPLAVPIDPKVLKAFGDKPVTALWDSDHPLSKGLPFYTQWKTGEPRTFSALVMGQPSLEDGSYFKADWLIEYDLGDLPLELRKYGASDHATTTDERNDPNVLGCVGVDSRDHIWVMPDLTWERIETDEVVERLLYHFKTHKPDLWWAEKDVILKSIGPFLIKRMQEMGIYTTIDPVTPAQDKPKRARSIQGRMSMGMVHFPRGASWWQAARSELLQFPYGAHDDFVDWLAYIGMGLTKEVKATPKGVNNVVYLKGTMQYALQEARKRGLKEPREAGNRGW